MLLGKFSIFSILLSFICNSLNFFGKSSNFYISLCYICNFSIVFGKFSNLLILLLFIYNILRFSGKYLGIYFNYKLLNTNNLEFLNYFILLILYPIF
jgi:hypothetical protein